MISQHEMTLVLIDHLAKNYFIKSQCLHNQFERVSSTSTEDDDIIYKSEMVNLGSSPIHVKTMILRLVIKLLRALDKTSTPRMNRAGEKGSPYFKPLIE